MEERKNKYILEVSRTKSLASSQETPIQRLDDIRRKNMRNDPRE
jgi:hypothetical protein